MAITSIGYDGTIDEIGWATIQAGLARTPGIDGGGMVPSITAGVTTPTVSLSAGAAFAYGVHVTNTASLNVAVPSPPTTAGTNRWDTLVVRRTWTGTGGTSTIVFVTGTATKALASGLNANPGTVHDQPIALVRSMGGQALVQEIQDVREWPTPGVFFPGDNWTPQQSRFAYGQDMYWRSSMYGALHLVRRGNTGSETWDNFDDPPWLALSLGTNVVAGPSGASPQYRVRRGELQLRGEAGAGATSPFVTGTAAVVGTLPTTAAPTQNVGFCVPTAGASGGHPAATRAFVATNGQITVTVISPGSFGSIYIDAIRYGVATGI